MTPVSQTNIGSALRNAYYVNIKCLMIIINLQKKKKINNAILKLWQVGVEQENGGF